MLKFPRSAPNVELKRPQLLVTRHEAACATYEERISSGEQAIICGMTKTIEFQCVHHSPLAG